MIEWKKTAELNGMTVEECKVYFDKYPNSAKKVVRICDGFDCSREDIVIKKRADKLCNSCAHKGNKHTSETKKKMSESHKGHTTTIETKEKIRESNKQHYIDNPEKLLEISKRTIKWHEDHPEFTEDLSIRQSGDGNVSKRDDVNKKMKESSKKRWEDPKEHEKDSIALKKWYKDHPEAGAEHSKFLIDWRKDTNNKDIITRMVEGMTKYWRSEEGREFARQRRLNQDIPTRDTSIEIKIQNILKENGYDFVTHQSCCNICIPDILFPEKKVIVQCDGDYWHNFPCGNEKDHMQDEILEKNGWHVLRFWECMINDNIQLCFNIFEEFYKHIDMIE